MSRSPSSAVLMFGIAVGADQLLVLNRSRGCDHNESEAKFCSECGKPMWNEKKYTRDMKEIFDRRHVGEVGLLRCRDDLGDEEPQGIVGKMVDLAREYTYSMTDTTISSDDLLAIKAFCESQQIPFNLTAARYYLVCN